MASNRNTRHSPAFVMAMISIGAGFILVGVVLFMVLKTSAAPSTDLQPDEFSTIPAKVNYPAPELTLTDLSGNSVSLTDYAGQVVLVNMWATWCPPCKAEMPTLQAFYEKYKDKGFTIVAINDGDTIDLVQPFVEQYHLTFPVWLDEKWQSESAFKTQNLPSSYVIDRDGTIRLMWIGAISPRVLNKYVPDLIEE